MPHVNVYVDTREVLDDMSDSELLAELRRRKNKGDIGGSSHLADYTIPQKVAMYTLEEAADILRGQGRTDLAFKLEEIRTDFVGH